MHPLVELTVANSELEFKLFASAGDRTDPDSDKYI
jgi:hypothetical protein